MLKFDLHHKRFRVAANDAGVSNEHTMFEYRVNGNRLIGWYFCGPIVVGQIVGTVINDETLDLRFQCLTVNGELKSGRSRATVSAAESGRLTMSFEWSWLLPDDGPPARSIHVEV